MPKTITRIAHAGRSFCAETFFVDPPDFDEFRRFKGLRVLVATVANGKRLMRWVGIKQDGSLGNQVEIPAREHNIWLDRIAGHRDRLRRQLPVGKVCLTDELTRLATRDPASLSSAKLRKVIAYSQAADAEFLRQVCG